MKEFEALKAVQKEVTSRGPGIIGLGFRVSGERASDLGYLVRVSCILGVVRGFRFRVRGLGCRVLGEKGF